VLLYRVFPYAAGAADGEPGHPLFVHPGQDAGRWDNPDLYRAFYGAVSPSGAVGEAFADLPRWRRDMLVDPRIPGARRSLGVYVMNEEKSPILDLDDAKALLDRGLRPTDVVVRNRPRTQQIARAVFNERRWSGLGWWSMHRPQWGLLAVWDRPAIQLDHVEPLPGHPALQDAATLLGKQVAADLRQ
jgi:hypothetical protein